MQLKTSKILSIILLLFIYSNNYAQEAEGEEPKNKLSFNGYIDAYYSYNTNNPGNGGNFGDTGVGRIFDGAHNQIALGLAQLVTKYTTNRSEVVMDIVLGPNAELANFGNTGTALTIKQAYISTSITDYLTFTIGQYGTHIGYELIDAPENVNYSLSNLFGNGPFYHTGAKLDYAIGEKFGLMLGVVNGWDAIVDNNRAKSIAAQVSTTPIEGLGIYLNWIGGNEDALDPATADNTDSYKQMFDLTASWSITDKFGLGVNAAYGTYRFTNVTNTWNGAALYLNYQISEKVQLGFRGESFDDSNGVQYLGTSTTGFTITSSIEAANGAVIIKPEIRFDSAKDPIYFSTKDNTLTDSQATIGLAVIGKF